MFWFWYCHLPPPPSPTPLPASTMTTPPLVHIERAEIWCCLLSGASHVQGKREREEEREDREGGRDTPVCAEGWLWKHLYFCVYSPSKQMRKQFEWAERGAGQGQGRGGATCLETNTEQSKSLHERIFHGICFNWLIDVLIGKSNCCGEFYDIFAATPCVFFLLFFGEFWILFPFLVFFFLVFASCVIIFFFVASG